MTLFLKSFHELKILLLFAALFVGTLVEGQARESTERDQIELKM